MSKPQVGIINITGYAGIELARLLAAHPDVELVSVTGRSTALYSEWYGFQHPGVVPTGLNVPDFSTYGSGAGVKWQILTWDIIKE